MVRHQGSIPGTPQSSNGDEEDPGARHEAEEGDDMIHEYEDIYLLGIPSLHVKISKRDSTYRKALRFHSPFRTKLNKLTYSPIVARALPRTSKGITDLLLLPTSSNLYKASPSKKQIFYSKNCTI